jgi:hypothetical protein
MIAGRSLVPRLAPLLGLIIVATISVAQDETAGKPTTQPPPPDKITRVVPVIGDHGERITRLEIELQMAPNNMEPVAEPRRIRINDRANVQFLLIGLSPMDVCSRSASAPTPTAETPVGESFVTTIAGFGGLAVGGSAPKFLANSKINMDIFNETMEGLDQATTKLAAPTCKIEADPEYKALVTLSKKFFPDACGLIGTSKPDDHCKNDPGSQLRKSADMDLAARQLAAYLGQDFRGSNAKNFEVAHNSDLQNVRDLYSSPLKPIEAAGRLQALVDEMSAWAADLHKKYDYSVSAGDSTGSAPSAPPVIPGALVASPTDLSFSDPTQTLMIKLTSGGQSSGFTATATSDTGWLFLAKQGATSKAVTVRDSAPARGTFNLLVSIDPQISAVAHYGSIAISGMGPARGTTIVNVVFKPSTAPDSCTLLNLGEIDKIVDQAKAEMSLLSDNNKSLETAQTSLKTAYMAVLKVEDDLNRRKDQKIVIERSDGTLVQEFNLGTDRKATSTGSIACVSDVDGKTPTTTNINYSLLYQNIPNWSASAGFLFSFQQKKIIGIADEIDTTTTPPTDVQFFRVTDQARFQFIPMAFVNRRIGGYKITHYGKNKEDDLIWTAHLSGGFGVNPNTGTNQPEFFGGFALGLNRLMLHSGVHVGRTESLGGGYVLNTMVPAGLSTTPISWSYHPAFTIGFSVRLAPY